MNIIRSHEREYIPASHENPDAPGVLKKVLLRRDELIQGGVQMINWALLPRGNAFQPHYHEDMEEIFIIIKGTARITIDNEEEMLSAGDTVVIPVRSVHVMEAAGEDDVEYIALGISQGKGGKTVVV